MNFFLRLLSVLMIAVLIVAPARATDTDYPCLHACIQEGKSSASCMSKCTSDKNYNQNVQKHTDYRCVDLCKGQGKPLDACLSLCVYTAPNTAAVPHPPTTGGATLATHEMLKAPAPAGDTLLKPHESTAIQTADKNYSCVPQCLHDGMQYDLCNQNCMAVTPEFNKTTP